MSTTTAAPSASPPDEVVRCLRNSRFLHLGTCQNDIPHVSLMNYTYLSSSPWTTGPAILMTTTTSSTKVSNIKSNPSVSLLVHDWVSPRAAIPHRPDDTATDGPASELTVFLQSLNSSALSSVSVTINGNATLIVPGSEQESWLRQQHCKDTWPGTDDSRPEPVQISTTPQHPGLDDVDFAVRSGPRNTSPRGDVIGIIVAINSGRTADWEGNITDWDIKIEE